MSNVVTMSGAPLMDVPRLLEYLSNRDDIESFAVVLLRKDGMNEVVYTRQSISNLSFAAACLNSVVMPMVDNAIAESE